MISDASKTLLLNTVKEWNKYTAELNKFTQVANEVAVIARKVIMEQIQFMKTQNIDVQAESPDSMKVLGVPVIVQPVIEATFPTVKGSVLLKCGGAARMIIINANFSISAGGSPVVFEQLQRMVPESFATNGAEFVRDAFLNVARTGGKENPAA